MPEDSQQLPRLFTLHADFAHPNAEVQPTKGGNGVHVVFANGWVVSIQWGPGTYSSNHRAISLEFPWPEMDASVAEIAAWHKDGSMITWPDGDTVQGWESWDEVQAVLDKAEAGELESVGADA